MKRLFAAAFAATLLAGCTGDTDDRTACDVLDEWLAQQSVSVYKGELTKADFADHATRVYAQCPELAP